MSYENDGLQSLTLAYSEAYDPSKLDIQVDGVKIVGFEPTKKVDIQRGIGGQWSAKIHLLVGSLSIRYLKEMLGGEVHLSVDYQNQPGGRDFSPAINFSGYGVLTGYSVSLTSEVPVLIFTILREGDI